MLGECEHARVGATTNASAAGTVASVPNRAASAAAAGDDLGRTIAATSIGCLAGVRVGPSEAAVVVPG